MDIGAIPCGDVMVALFVILLGCIFMKFKKSSFETMMRKFEKKFIWYYSVFDNSQLPGAD